MRKIGNHTNAQFFIGDLSQEKVIKSKQLLEDEGFIVSVDSRIMTIYRKNNTRTIISDPYDFLYRSRHLMEIAGIFEGIMRASVGDYNLDKRKQPDIILAKDFRITVRDNETNMVDHILATVNNDLVKSYKEKFIKIRKTRL